MTEFKVYPHHNAGPAEVIEAEEPVAAAAEYQKRQPSYAAVSMAVEVAGGKTGAGSQQLTVVGPDHALTWSRP